MKGSYCDNVLYYNGVECYLIFFKMLSEVFCLFFFVKKLYLFLELCLWKVNLLKDLNFNWFVSCNFWFIVVFWWLIVNYSGVWYLMFKIVCFVINFFIFFIL